ncbi:MAG: translation initiation factor [Bacteroidetes bacterium]|jgi:translation initiation factor 1|nr:translation initiation factor [Bacteroidota bacterium]MBP8916368.1 translation initiation factor [Chitinophagales bacterium]MBP9795227.1 translation initiation factor [Chitinophagales bacterium]
MAKKNNDKFGFVFSTDPDFKFEKDKEKQNTLPPQQQDLRVWLEKNHRGGKTACVIKNFIGSDEDLEKLGKELKTKCGTGGSVKDGEIIIQGDQRKKLGEILTKLGYKYKLAGG